jgi:hypothetical protein
MVASQQVQHLLLGVLTGQPADALGQGSRGVAGDNAQAEFQRRERGLLVIAGLLQRLVKAAVKFDAAEQGGDT